MRTFIGVEVPQEIQNEVGDYITSIRRLFGSNVKWVSPRNLHFTIKFLGEISQNELEIAEECVAMTTADYSPFTLGLSGIGFFPSVLKPRVLWIGTDGGGDKLLDVYQYLENCLEHDGFDRDAKPFSPHLTIGRVRKNKKMIVPDALVEFRPVVYEVKRLAVIKSTLTPNGPIYEKLFESELKRQQ